MPRISLSVYMARESVHDFDELIGEEKRTTLDAEEFAAFDLAGKVYVKRPEPHPPTWRDFVRQVAPQVLTSEEVSSMGCAIVLACEGITYAITFGTGHSFLDRTMLAPDFGLRVSVNGVVEDELRTVDAMNIHGIVMHQRQQSTRRTGLGDFQIARDRDLLTSVTGVPLNTELLGSSLTGATSLRFTPNIEWPNMRDLLTELKKLYESDDYKRRGFEWIDHFQAITDVRELARLDAVLMDHIASGNTDELFLSAPEVIEWNNPKFKYQHRKRQQFREELEWSDYLSFLQQNNLELSLANLKNHELHCFEGESEEPEKSWKIYECLHYELVERESTNILINGRWFRVDNDYVERLDAEVSRIPSCKLQLPDICDGTEDEYIDSASKAVNPRGVKLHTEMIFREGGQGQIEFCDLLVDRCTLVHVKRHGRKQKTDSISHLFQQTMHSANLMMNDATFREMVNQKLATLGEEPLFNNVAVRPRDQQWKITIVLIDHTLRTNTSLPLFTRLSLRNANNTLSNYGFDVSTHYVLRN